MNLKKSLRSFYQKETLLVVGLLLVALLIVVVLGNKEQVMMTFLQIQWVLATGMYLFGLQEITNVTRLGWGTPRARIHAKFLQGLILMILIMSMIWILVLGLFALREETLKVQQTLIHQILWSLSSLFFLSQMGLLFGNCQMKEWLPFVILTILLTGLLWGSVLSSWITTLALLALGFIVNGINHRLVRNMKVMRFVS
ncbi:MAG: hypothetical protein PHY42_00670 [Bacilli bacterium]|nr:hypothetical protein [Bacilli bacterium]